jgi:hypothetical protein
VRRSVLDIFLILRIGENNTQTGANNNPIVAIPIGGRSPNISPSQASCDAAYWNHTGSEESEASVHPS